MSSLETEVESSIPFHSRVLEVIRQKRIPEPFGPFHQESTYSPWVRSAYFVTLIDIIYNELGEKGKIELFRRFKPLIPPDFNDEDIAAYLTDPNREIHSLVNEALIEIGREILFENQKVELADRLYFEVYNKTVDPRTHTDWLFSLGQYLSKLPFIPSIFIWAAIGVGNDRMNNVQKFRWEELKVGFAKVLKTSDQRYLDMYLGYFGESIVGNEIRNHDNDSNLGALSAVPVFYKKSTAGVRVQEIQGAGYGERCYYLIKWNVQQLLVPLEWILERAFNNPFIQNRILRNWYYDALQQHQLDLQRLEQANLELRKTRKDMMIVFGRTGMESTMKGVTHEFNNQYITMDGAIAMMDRAKRRADMAYSSLLGMVLSEDERKLVDELIGKAADYKSEKFGYTDAQLIGKRRVLANYFKERGFVNDDDDLKAVLLLPFAKEDYDMVFELEQKYGVTVCNAIFDYLISTYQYYFNRQTVNAAKEVIGRITTSIRGYAGIMEGEIRPYAINEEIRHLVQLVDYRLRYNYPGIKIDVEEGDDLPTITSYANLNIALMCMLNNAVEAIGNQDGLIKIRTYRSSEILDTSAVDCICCEISDTGCGIQSEYMEKLFEPFFTTKPSGQGIGLGLFTAKDLVVGHHGGKINVQSEVGQGSTFRVYLPINYKPIK